MAVKWESDARRTENVEDESVDEDEGAESLEVMKVKKEERRAILGWEETGMGFPSSSWVG